MLSLFGVDVSLYDDGYALVFVFFIYWNVFGWALFVMFLRLQSCCLCCLNDPNVGFIYVSISVFFKYVKFILFIILPIIIIINTLLIYY